MVVKPSSNIAGSMHMISILDEYIIRGMHGNITNSSDSVEFSRNLIPNRIPESAHNDLKVSVRKY